MSAQLSECSMNNDVLEAVGAAARCCDDEVFLLPEFFKKSRNLENRKCQKNLRLELQRFSLHKFL